MKSYERVKDNIYFNKIIKNGLVKKNKYYVIYKINSKNYLPKIGIAVSTKLGHAFFRNKLKRQIRNICDNNKILFSNNKDYIIILTRACINVSYQTLNDEFINIMKDEKGE